MVFTIVDEIHFRKFCSYYIIYELRVHETKHDGCKEHGDLAVSPPDSYSRYPASNVGSDTDCPD
jgi:hypothetical protein